MRFVLFAPVAIAISCAGSGARPGEPSRGAPLAPAAIEAGAREARDASEASAPAPDASSPSGVCTTRSLGQSAGGALAACASDADCALTWTGCCACGALPVERVRAVSRRALARSSRPLCDAPATGCGECAAWMPDAIAAACEHGHCVVTEDACTGACPSVRAPALLPQTLSADLAGCTAPGDCVVATRECCPCGGITPSDAVAVNRIGRRQLAAACEGKAAGCSCSHQRNGSLAAECVAGVCRVRDTGLDPRCARAAQAPAAAADAGATSCAAAADYVGYKVDLGVSEHAASMGMGPTDEKPGPPIRASLVALTIPKDMDAFNFATYLPYYVALAYEELIEGGHPAVRGTVRVVLALDASGSATSVRITAPGFPRAFVDEVRDRATTRYVTCAPLPPGAAVKATITLAPRSVRQPGR